MKYSILLLLSLCLLLMGASPRHEPSASQKLIRDYVFIPSGREGDSILPEFYISAIEITNLQYRTFVNDLIDSGAMDRVRIAMVDILQWKKVLLHSTVSFQYYYQDTAYNDCPVVNVSRRAALLYCDWLTEKYNRSSKQKVRFSLPTELQWQYAARGGNLKALYPWPGNSLTYEHKGKIHGRYMANFLRDTCGADSDSETMTITTHSHSFIPNTYEIYNMGGNVAEMVSDHDYTKGGSYLSHADKLLITAHEDVDLTHGLPMVGFRPVMVYVKE